MLGFFFFDIVKGDNFLKVKIGLYFLWKRKLFDVYVNDMRKKLMMIVVLIEFFEMLFLYNLIMLWI